MIHLFRPQKFKVKMRYTRTGISKMMGKDGHVYNASLQCTWGRYYRTISRHCSVVYQPMQSLDVVRVNFSITRDGIITYDN